jgi:hypothetical protein
VVVVAAASKEKKVRRATSYKEAYPILLTVKGFILLVNGEK